MACLWYDSKLQSTRYPKKLVTNLQMCKYSINKFYCSPRKQHPDQFHSLFPKYCKACSVTSSWLFSPKLQLFSQEILENNFIKFNLLTVNLHTFHTHQEQKKNYSIALDVMTMQKKNPKQNQQQQNAKTNNTPLKIKCTKI